MHTLYKIHIDKYGSCSNSYNNYHITLANIFFVAVDVQVPVGRSWRQLHTPAGRLVSSPGGQEVTDGRCFTAGATGSWRMALVQVPKVISKYKMYSYFYMAPVNY